MAWILRMLILIALALAAPAAAQGQATPPTRVALVIANGAYQAVPPLTNPARDGVLIVTSLRQAGFSVNELKRDLTKTQFDAALRDFKRQADAADIALVYYAGHGIELEEKNWLLPVDARIADPVDALTEGVSLDTVLSYVRGARRMRIVVLDACRNNPFALKLASPTRALTRGLRPVEGLPSGTIVAYAASFGQEAAEGVGANNSPFATALAKRIVEPGLEVRFLFANVRDDVIAANAASPIAAVRSQRPWIGAELSAEPVYFVSPAEPRMVLSNQPRLALVIGNGDYDLDGRYTGGQHVAQGFAPDLQNSANDGGDISAALQRIGFKVDYVQNGTHAQMVQAIASFAQKIYAAGPDAIVVFYYAGHAITIGGENYLVPVGVKLPTLDFAAMPESATQLVLASYTIPLRQVVAGSLRTPSAIGLNLLVLDAGRTNPLGDDARGRISSRGLAEPGIDIRRTAIAYATKPGSFAADGIDRNSPYTKALKDWIERPGLSVRELFDGVAVDVESATGGRQSPWLNAPPPRQNMPRALPRELMRKLMAPGPNRIGLASTSQEATQASASWKPSVWATAPYRVTRFEARPAAQHQDCGPEGPRSPRTVGARPCLAAVTDAG